MLGVRGSRVSPERWGRLAPQQAGIRVALTSRWAAWRRDRRARGPAEPRGGLPCAAAAGYTDRPHLAVARLGPPRRGKRTGLTSRSAACRAPQPAGHDPRDRAVKRLTPKQPGTRNVHGDSGDRKDFSSPWRNEPGLPFVLGSDVPGHCFYLTICAWAWER